MCILLISIKPNSALPIIIASNRDEFHTRPTETLSIWKDNPNILGGRDMEANGTWLAINKGGHFAAITNLPTNITACNLKSRGNIVTEALTSKLQISSFIKNLMN